LHPCQIAPGDFQDPRIPLYPDIVGEDHIH
jgi:hypothetical protein